jgi:2,6-dihydroxypseudooxynicotine hydrolase
LSSADSSSVEFLKKFLESSKELAAGGGTGLDMNRMMQEGLNYSDFLKVCDKIRNMDEWCPLWMDEALVHQRIAEKALAEGNTITAGEAFWRASMYNHYGQFLQWDNPIKQEAIKRKVEAFKHAAPLLVPPAERVEVKFENITLPGYMRLPIGKKKPPCVICISGLESSQEEYYVVGNLMLQRGLATFSFDGPGQGEVYDKMKARPDFEKPTGAVIDYLQSRKDIDTERIGAYGRSFGGYYVIRAAAFEKRIKAAVALGSVDWEKTWDKHTVSLKNGWTHVSGKRNWDEAKEFFMSFTLRNIADKITCPLYIMHGSRDAIFPTETAEYIKKHAKGPVTLDMEEGTHCLHPIAHIIKPRIVDWLAKILKA